jgi:hypothetical protein
MNVGIFPLLLENWRTDLGGWWRAVEESRLELECGERRTGTQHLVSSGEIQPTLPEWWYGTCPTVCFASVLLLYTARDRSRIGIFLSQEILR